MLYYSLKFGLRLIFKYIESHTHTKNNCMDSVSNKKNKVMIFQAHDLSCSTDALFLLKINMFNYYMIILHHNI